MLVAADKWIVVTITGIAISVILGMVVVLSYGKNVTQTTLFSSENRNAGNKFVSQIPIGYAQSLVKSLAINPIEASRLYAYTASVCYDILLDTNEDNYCKLGVSEIVQELYPTEAMRTKAWSSKNTSGNIATDNKTKDIIEKYRKRINEDGFKTINDQYTIPNGEGKWKLVKNQPISPNAINWKKWLVTTSLSKQVPPPIVPGDTRYEEQKTQVVTAVNNRTVNDLVNITYWAGGSGTETPSGIWQNKLAEYTTFQNITKLEYAKIQTILAQAIADSFIEVWGVKYLYWTERPSMAISGLKASMENPNFPSYVSGHATISSTAVKVIGTMLPQYKEQVLKDATTAKNSRLLAGIHFPMDNEEGWKLGQKVGEIALNVFDR